MVISRTAADRIRHFLQYDPPIANIIRLILKTIVDGTGQGKNYDELVEQDSNECRIKETFQGVNMGNSRFYWKELPGPGFNRKVLVVVITAGPEPQVLNVGYIPRQGQLLR